MFRNYLKTALRFLKRNKLFAGINALGLSIALAASFIILLFVINELSYNHCHKNRNQVYRVLTYLSDLKVRKTGTPFLLAKTMKEEFPQVEKSITARNVPSFKLKLGEEWINVRNAVATSSEVFDIFTIPLIEGARSSNLLADQNTLVLSRELAGMFFPGQNATGKEITANADGNEQVLTITGVFENIPVNSTFQARCFVNSKWTIESTNRNYKITDSETKWDIDSWDTWVMLSPNTQMSDVDKQLKILGEKHLVEKPPRSLSLQKLTDVYLHSDEIWNTGNKGNMKNIRLFGAIAFLIILVAGINYIILSTAVSTGRAKEIGIRKTNGADRKSIRRQMLGESILLAAIALPVAIGLMYLGMPYAGKLFGTRLQIIGSNLFIYILAYLLLTLFIGISSGIYTSTYLSGLKVIQILKNSTGTGKQKLKFRSSLIVAQLVIFCVFVSSTLVIRAQYEYAVNKDTGHYKDDVILIDLGRNFKAYPAFINSIKSIPNVVSTAGSADILPMRNTFTFMADHFTEPGRKIQVEGMSVDFNYIKTMGIQLVEGRDFSEEFGSDLTQSIILNEKAVKQLGIDNPIGKTFIGKNIIGIVKDFNLHSIHTDIPPMYIFTSDRLIKQVAVRYVPGSLESLLPVLENEWKKVAPDRPFSYSTVDDVVKSLYVSEKNLSTIVSIFALFTLLIAAFGLFGLTLFTARARTREIGIKKIFGSSEKAIVFSFLKSNTLLVLIAALISIPVTYYFMTRWLNGFSFHTNIRLWVFAVAFAVAATVVLVTVLYHSWRASRINPVEALRYE